MSYDIFSNPRDRKLSKKDEELVMKSVSGYSCFVGDFIARASIDSVENSELSDSEKRHVPEVGGVNGFSISYDLDRDGRDVTIQVYFRQTNYAMTIEKEGVKVDVDACFNNSREEIKSIEVALKDINGDRRQKFGLHTIREVFGAHSAFSNSKDCLS